MAGPPFRRIRLSHRALREFETAAPGLGEPAARRALGLAQTREAREASMSGLDIATTADRRHRKCPTLALSLATEWAESLQEPLLRAWAHTIRAHRLSLLGRYEAAAGTLETIFGLVMGDMARREALVVQWNYRVDLELRTGRRRRALDLLGERPAWDEDPLRSVRILHANDLAAPEDWMETLRARRDLPGTKWHDRERLGRLLDRQSRLGEAAGAQAVLGPAW